MKFTCEIEMENAAFEETPASELARILRKIARLAEVGDMDGFCYDTNGNHIGRWRVERSLGDQEPR